MRTMVQRAAETLGTLLQDKPALLLEFVRHCPSPEALATLADLATAPVSAVPPVRSALARADAEDELAEWLQAQGFTVFPSEANFLLFGPFDDRDAVWQRLLDRGVLIRVTGPAPWLRVTVGTPQENAMFRTALLESR